jgi:hypothetical protein
VLIRPRALSRPRPQRYLASTKCGFTALRAGEWSWLPQAAYSRACLENCDWGQMASNWELTYLGPKIYLHFIVIIIHIIWYNSVIFSAGRFN